MSLFFNMLSRLAITFLPRSKHLLISWLQSPSVVILEPKRIKSLIVSIVSPSICHEVMGPDAMIFIFWMLSFKSTFSTLLFHFHQEALWFLFTFCHKSGVICISEVIAILIVACASSHSLAYEITQSVTNYSIFQGLSYSEMAHTLVCGVYFLQGCSCFLRWTTFCLWNVYLSK